MRGFPTRYVVYDTETTAERLLGHPDTEQLRFRVGVALVHDGTPGAPPAEQFLHFTDTDEFFALIDALPLSSNPLWIFAHNHGFDARIVGWFRQVSLGRYSMYPGAAVKGRGRFKEPLAILASPPFLVRLFRPDGQVIFLTDTYQWFERSLAAIGDQIGMPKGKVHFEDCPIEELITYCERDVLILEEAIKRMWQFLKRVRVRDWQPTRAAQAMMIFRSGYERKRIRRPKDAAPLKFARLSYYGGKVECFYIGKREGAFYQVDVNSMYPWVMKECLMPVEIIESDLDPERRVKGHPPHPAQTTGSVAALQGHRIPRAVCFGHPVLQWESADSSRGS